MKEFGKYLIDEDGNVFTKSLYKSRWKIEPNEKGLYPRKTFFTNDGYERIELRKDGKVFKVTIHRLVYELYKGEIPKGMTVDHIDENKLNNNYSNLQLLTSKENSVKANQSKLNALSDDKVIAIRKEYLESRISQKELSVKYNTNKTSIHNIVNNKSYTWL